MKDYYGNEITFEVSIVTSKEYENEKEKDLCIKCSKASACKHKEGRVLENEEKYSKMDLVSYVGICIEHD